MALIDPAIIKKLVLTALADADPVLAGFLVGPHEEDPTDEESGELWFRLVSIDTFPIPRVGTPQGRSGKEIDLATLAIVIVCHASDRRVARDDGDNVLDLAAAELKRVLSDHTEIDQASGHQVHFRSVQVRDLSAIARSRSIRGRQLIVDAHASRGSGTSQSPHASGGDVVVIGD